MRASSWVSTAVNGRSDGADTGEQGPREWCSGRCMAELFRCSKSAACTCEEQASATSLIGVAAAKSREKAATSRGSGAGAISPELKPSSHPLSPPLLLPPCGGWLSAGYGWV
uniref:Uncharacterized protein n=1 Tax=Triticum urartu TaxID=4572 RepID=A0A8R7UWS8_TRIUA